MRMNFKIFVGLNIRTSNEVLSMLVDFDVKELAFDQRNWSLPNVQQRLKFSKEIHVSRRKTIKTPLLSKIFGGYIMISKNPSVHFA